MTQLTICEESLEKLDDGDLSAEETQEHMESLQISFDAISRNLLTDKQLQRALVVQFQMKKYETEASA